MIMKQLVDKKGQKRRTRLVIYMLAIKAGINNAVIFWGYKHGLGFSVSLSDVRTKTFFILSKHLSVIQTRDNNRERRCQELLWLY